MRILANLFPDAHSYASQANARRKLEKFKGALGDCLTVEVQRNDGRWLAVVIKQDRDTINIPFLCHNGICVTN